MHYLVIPIDFKNSYFFKNRPRWLLSLPNGRLMVEESISSNIKNVTKIIIVCPSEHFKKSIKEISVIASMQKSFKKEVQIIKSSKQLSKIESINLALEKAFIDGPFFVKDPYNKFTFNYKNNNVLIHDKEKKLFNSDFGFHSGHLFLSEFHNFKKKNLNLKGFINYLKKENYKFDSKFLELEDNWSSLESYRAFQRKYATLFLDVDGTLLKNGSKFVDGSWKTKPILKNMKAISNLQKNHNLYIVITTSRPSSEKKYLEKVFKEYKIEINSYLFDLPHCQRILVNDFFESNPYPSAIAINLERDHDNLKTHLDSILKN